MLDEAGDDTSQTATEPVDPNANATAGVVEGEQQANTQAGDADEQTKTLTQDEVDKIVKARLAKEARKHQRELSDARAQADAFRQLVENRQAQQAPQPPANVRGGNEPQREKYDSYEDFIEARAEYRATQAVERKLAESQQQAAYKSEADRLQSLERQFAEREAVAREKFDDYDETVRSLRGVPKHVVEFLGESEKGPELLYALASDPKVFERVKGLSQAGAMRELVQMELSAGKPAPKEASKAPSPVRPVTARSSSADSLPSDSDDIETWKRKEFERMRKVGRLR